MSASATPELALAYLRELSADIAAGVILDSGGRRLAGSPDLAADAAALLDAMGDAGALEARSADALLFAARSRRHFVLVVTRSLALPGLVRHELQEALAMLDEPPPASAAAPSEPAPPLGIGGDRAAGLDRNARDDLRLWLLTEGRRRVEPAGEDPRTRVLRRRALALMRTARTATGGP